MKNLLGRNQRISASTRAAAGMEYGAVVAVIAIAAITTVSSMATAVQDLYKTTAIEVNEANTHVAVLKLSLNNDTGEWEIERDPVAESAPDKPEEEVAISDPVSEPTPHPDPPPESEPALAGDDSEGPGGDPDLDLVEGAPVPVFSLTMNNGINNAAIDFSRIGVPHAAYEFSLSGTGDTNPSVKAYSSGTATEGYTIPEKIHISIKKPKKAQIETITLTIAGQEIVWTVGHDHRNRTNRTRARID